MILGDIILNYRKSFNPKISQRDFAKRCGLSHTYIAALEKNIDPRTGKPIAPTLDTVKYVAQAMNLSIEDLLKMLDDDQEFILNADAPRYEEIKYFMCPVYGQISAGQPNWAEECIEGRLPLDSDLMGIVKPEEHFFLRVNGESMNKIVKNGAFALIHKQDIVENGEIAVVLVNGYDATLKKFTKQGDVVILEPDSNDDSFKMQIYDKTTPIKILGKYVGKMEFNK